MPSCLNVSLRSFNFVWFWFFGRKIINWKSPNEISIKIPRKIPIGVVKFYEKENQLQNLILIFKRIKSTQFDYRIGNFRCPSQFSVGWKNFLDYISFNEQSICVCAFCAPNVISSKGCWMFEFFLVHITELQFFFFYFCKI